MRQLTIITKDGSKWLRPFNPHPEKVSTHWASIDVPYYIPEWQEFEKDNFDLPYIGSHPEGTTLDESEVRDVNQYRRIGSGFEWVTAVSEQTRKAAEIRPDFELRTVYTDAESHDTSNDNPRYPLFSHMSSEHGLALLDSELDEIARHA